jgi:hypothetical protein
VGAASAPREYPIGYIPLYDFPKVPTNTSEHAQQDEESDKESLGLFVTDEEGPGMSDDED